MWILGILFPRGRGNEVDKAYSFPRVVSMSCNWHKRGAVLERTALKHETAFSVCKSLILEWETIVEDYVDKYADFDASSDDADVSLDLQINKQIIDTFTFAQSELNIEAFDQVFLIHCFKFLFYFRSTSSCTIGVQRLTTKVKLFNIILKFVYGIGPIFIKI